MNSAIVATKLILSLFKDVKSIQVISDFNLKRMKQISRWRCGTKISKINLKTMISPLLRCPKAGVPGVSKNQEDQTEDHFVKLEC